MAVIQLSSITNLMAERWRPGFHVAANEEEVVAKEFTDASDGAMPGAQNKLYLRKMAAIAGSSITTTAPSAVTITGLDPADTNVTITPTFFYAGVEITLDILANIDSRPDLEAAYKKALMEGLAAAIDSNAASTVSAALSYSAGNGAANIDKSVILDAIGTLIVNAKSRFKPGVTPAYFKVFNKQAKHIINIADITSAYIRGDNANPVVRGWVMEAFNLKFEESGNLYSTGGTAHSLLYLPTAFAKAYNMKPQLLKPQEQGVAVRFIAAASVGFCEYNEEDAVDVLSTDV